MAALRLFLLHVSPPAAIAVLKPICKARHTVLGLLIPYRHGLCKVKSTEKVKNTRPETE